jgi:anthranilate synthase component I
VVTAFILARGRVPEVYGLNHFQELEEIAMEETSKLVEGAESGFFPGEAEFMALARDYNMLTVEKVVNADLETPVGAFMKLAHPEYAFLLESAERGERWGRYSFIGCEPLEIVKYHNGRLTCEPEAGETSYSNPVDFLFDRLRDLRTEDTQSDLPFRGGAVGYLSYDLLPFLEDVRLHSSQGLDLPEMAFMLTRTSAAFDHLLGRMTLMANVFIPPAADAAKLSDLYHGATDSIMGMLKSLHQPISTPQSSDVRKLPQDLDFQGVSSNRDQSEYEEMVRISKEHIYAGDIFQVVPSQRFSLPLACQPFSIYRSLRSENPSPYMFFLRFGALSLIGSSPEPMVQRRDGTAVIRPIAGTRPRGANAEEDRALEEELKSDVKERAEHIMLVDLARNDLGRVCETGTVKVTRMMEVERFSHVMHLVSQVEGTLRPDRENRDLLSASFPAGTVCGAPKIRACEIIDELEGEKRGPYAGAVGYISYEGDMDTCIAIRTIVCHEGTAYIQAGAGIVADSDPRSEYEETRSKARALLRAIRVAQSREEGSR